MESDDLAVPEDYQDDPPKKRGGGWELSLLRIENKIDLVLARHDARISQLEADSKDHAIRLRRIEVSPVLRPSHIGWAIGASTPFVLALFAYVTKTSF